MNILVGAHIEQEKTLSRKESIFDKAEILINTVLRTVIGLRLGVQPKQRQTLIALQIVDIEDKIKIMGGQEA